MELNQINRAHEIQRNLISYYIQRLKFSYNNYEIFQSAIDPDYIIFRKKVGESKFGEKPNIFSVGIYKDVKIHFTELEDLK